MKRVFTGIALLLAGPKLSKAQWIFLASFSRTIAEGIVLGSSAAFFLPETFQLSGPIPANRYLLLLVVSLIFLIAGVIMTSRGKND